MESQTTAAYADYVHFQISSSGTAIEGGRLAGIGKIPKRTDALLVSEPQIFGQPEPGILDSAPRSSASLPQITLPGHLPPILDPVELQDVVPASAPAAVAAAPMPPPALYSSLPSRSLQGQLPTPSTAVEPQAGPPPPPPDAKPKMPPTQRGLYVQPKKFALLDDVPFLSRDIRAKMVHGNSVAKLTNPEREERSSSGSGRFNAVSNIAPLPQDKHKTSAYNPRWQGATGPLAVPPTQPRGWGPQQVLSGPSRLPHQAVDPRFAPAAPRVPPPLPPQSAAFLGIGRSPVWQPQAGGRLSPVDPRGVSPVL